MSVAGKLQAVANVVAQTGYYLGYRSFTKPHEARAFIRTVAETVANFDPSVAHKGERRLPRASLDALCPGIGKHAVTVRFIERTEHELPVSEVASLAALIRHHAPQRIMEIGTERGRTTLLFAEHAPARARIYTLNLAIDDMAAFRRVSRDAAHVMVGEAFKGKPAARKITQLFGDSRTFDFSPYAKSMDFIFIDGDHSYEGVKSDTERCLPMLRPGGIMIWDDYHAAFPGIVRHLEELAKHRAVFRIADTRFAFYRHETR